MRAALHLLVSIAVAALAVGWSPVCYAQGQTDEEFERALREELGAEYEYDFEEEEPYVEEEPFEEDFEDEFEEPDEELPPDEPLMEEEPVAPRLPVLPFQRRRLPEPGEPSVFVGEAGEEPTDADRKIIIDGMVKLNYVFNNAPESFIINYHFRIEGDIKAQTAVIRGDAVIDAKVDGFLAKWPTGECTLNITIPKAPFQVTFRKQPDEEEANLNLRFTRPITETWESSCSFGDAGAKPFVTTGDPEKWLQRALSKASPPLSRLVANVTEGEKTTTKFVISNHMINDPPLGTIQAEGTGVITIIPAGAEE